MLSLFVSNEETPTRGHLPRGDQAWPARSLGVCPRRVPCQRVIPRQTDVQCMWTRGKVTPTGVAIIKSNETKPNSNKCWRGRGEPGTTVRYCCWDCGLVQLSCTKHPGGSSSSHAQSDHLTPQSHFGVCAQKMRAGTRIATRTPMFTAAVFARAQRWQQAKRASTGEWGRKTWSVPGLEYYSAIKRNSSPPCFSLGEH